MKAILLFFFASLLVFRIFSDHTQNYQYTGDFIIEDKLIIAADNFEKLGARKTRLAPILVKAPSDSFESFAPYVYIHYPPLTYWLFGGTYLIFGHSVIAARILAVALSLLGLFFLFKIVKEFQLFFPESASKQDGVFYAIFVLLAFNPGFLFFSDNIQNHSLIWTLQWASLFWSLRYLFHGASIGWGILLYFLHVWISFEWMVPTLVIFCYCLFKKEGSPLKNFKPWGYFLGIGVLLPLALRIVHNAWVLGGVPEAIMDLFQKASVRSLGDTGELEMQYSVTKHIGKLFFGLLWFVGIPILLLFVIYFKELFQFLRKNRTLQTLFVLWGIGCASWQFLMPQSAMIHAETEVHMANFFFLAAALTTLFFWEKEKKILIPLILLYCIGAGMAIKSEIIIPFLSKSTGTLAKSVCLVEKQKLTARFNGIKSSMVRHIQKELKKGEGSLECGLQSKLATNILALYAYSVKSKLEMPSALQNP